MFYALVELGAVLLVKLNSIFLGQKLCVSAFVLCASGLVKLTLGFSVALDRDEVSSASEDG